MPARLALLAALLAAPAAAQPMAVGAPPVTETLALGETDRGSASFDARALALSGVDGCVGYVGPSAPDVAVEWGGGDLRVWVQAAFDATLLVHGPDGAWTCNDDAVGTSPVVDLADAPAGRYAVWLGAFSPDPVEPRATLYAGAPPPVPVLDAAAAPLAGAVTASGGFEAQQGMIEMAVEAGGPDRADALDGVPFCTGFLDAARPTAAADYTASGGTGALVVRASALDDDLVLLVRSPSGEVLCNDDFEGSDPLVEFSDPEDGRYVVWVGTFGARPEPVAATLVVSETSVFEGDIFGDDFQSAPYSEGTYTALDVTSTPGRRLQLGDERASVEATVEAPTANPVQGPSCLGSIEPSPTVGATLAGAGPVSITATGDVDLVLVVQTPGGTWYCSDDANGLNPGVQIDAPADGLYRIWAGTFGDLGEPVPVTITVARGELEVSSPGAGPPPVVVEPQSEGTYEGTAIRPGQPAVTVGMGASERVTPGGPVLNPVDGPACGGFVSERPTAAFEGGASIDVRAAATVDLTLVVRAPDGTWYCSDDAEGTDPRVRAYGHGPGTFSVWVGTFSRLESPSGATLTVDEAPSIED